MARELGQALAKKGGLTLAQLAEYDDVCTDALVDRVYFWAQIRKNRPRFSRSRGIQEEEVASILRDEVICEKDPITATEKMLELGGIKKYIARLKSQDEKEHFQRHLRKYVNFYLPDCPFEVTTTNRYTIDTQEASVTARRDIKKGETIKYLSGIQVAITEEEFKRLSRDDVRLDFSIVHSSRKKTPSLFLGPARFANHDCNANAKLNTTGKHGMEIIAIKPIKVGDEITVSYGTDYFGEDNCECLCGTCEKRRRNGWAPHTGDTDSDSEEEDGLHFDIDAALTESLGGGKDEHAGEEVAMNGGGANQALSFSMSRKRKSDEEDTQSGKRLKLSPRSSGQSTPRGRRTQREVNIKTEHPLSQSLEDLPALTAVEHSRQDTNTVATKPEEQYPPRSRTRQLRDSSNESGDSRPPSLFSRQSPQSTPATSDGDVSETVASATAIDSTTKPCEPASKTEALQISTSLAIQSCQPEDSDGALTPLSSFSTSTLTGTATRRSTRKKNPTAKKLWHRELAALREGSMERSLIASLSPSPSPPPSQRDSPALRSAPIPPPGKGRSPGDYTLTPRLLSTLYSRWNTCLTCTLPFVQEDAYLTRKECPRCERHSKLYGFCWPKTERDGRWDSEERVVDHRTIHRFVEPGVEKVIKKKRGRGRGKRSSTVPTPCDPARPTAEAAGSPSPRRRTRESGAPSRRAEERPASVRASPERGRRTRTRRARLTL